MKYHNCVIPYKYEMQANYVAWIPLVYNDIFQNQIIPKFLNKSISDDKKKRWSNHFSTLLSEHSLGYLSEEVYFRANNLNKKNVISNSLKIIFENNLDINNYEILTDCFYDLISMEKVKVIRENSFPIYKEITDLCFYIKQIQTLLKNYPLRSSEHKGTAYTTKFKSLIKTQINKLKERLEHPYFPITNPSEIEDTKMLLKLLNICLDKECKNTPEYLNFINAFYGLESKVLSLNKDDLRIIKLFLNFYNGIKTERIELIQSIAIKINDTFKELDIEASEKADLIVNIINIFFQDEVKKYNKSNSKRTFSYNAKSIKKASRVKTVLHDTLIYAYDNSRGSDIINEIFSIGINSMLGIKNIFEPHNPTKDEVSNIQMARSLLNVRNEFDLSMKELRIMLHLIKTYPIILEYSEKGNFPSR